MKPNSIYRLLAATLRLLAFAVCLTACAPDRSPAEADGMEYARWLRLSDGEGYSVAEVLDPWQPGTVLHRYVLEQRPGSAPDTLRGTRLAVPVRRAVSGISAHARLAFALGAGDCLAGITDGSYTVSPVLRRALADGRLTDCGDGTAPNTESIAALHPSALLLSPFDHAGYGALEHLGVPIVECADYMETTPLGRAEWMRFYGRLFGRAAEADSLFRAEEQAYRALCSESQHPKKGSRNIQAENHNPQAGNPHTQSESRPTPPRAPRLLTDCLTGDAWYVPGGQSYMAQMFADAGFAYAFADIAQTGGVPLSFETVAATAADADVWIIRTAQPLTRAALLAADGRYARFKALRQGNLWLCNTLRTPYYEEVPFAPSLLLRELIALRRPQRCDSLRYFTRL